MIKPMTPYPGPHEGLFSSADMGDSKCNRDLTSVVVYQNYSGQE